MIKREWNNLKERWVLLPLIMVLMIIPVIIRCYVYESSLIQYDWYSIGGSRSDFFLYYKSIWFVAACGIMVVIGGYKLLADKKWKKLPVVLIPLAVYAFFVLLSTLFSVDRSFSLNGMEGHFETVFVLLGYGVTVLYAVLVIEEKEDVQMLFRWWFIGVVVMIIFGICQAAGFDLIGTDFIKTLILPTEYLSQKDNIVFTMGEGVAYMTLYNPNYVGFFAVLVLPVFITLGFFTKNWVKRICCAAVCIGSLICLFSSGAKNGIIGVAAAIVLLGVLLLKKKFSRYWKGALGVLLLFVVMFFGYNAYLGNELVDTFVQAFTTFRDTEGEFPLEHIETGDDAVAITYKGNQFFIQTEKTGENDLSFTLTDQNGEPVEFVPLEDRPGIHIKDDRYWLPIEVVNASNTLAFSILIDGKSWIFSNQTSKGDGYYYCNSYGRFIKIQEAESAVFTNYTKLATGRGYIWSRTIPLLKDKLLIGSGPDTFMLEFPQDDYVAASRKGYHKQVMSKPHNMYLQMGVQTGVVSLLAFLCFYITYAVSSLRLYWRDPMVTYLPRVGAAILAATFGYMLSGIANDSTVCISPVYWCLMGIGIAVNIIIRKEQLQSQTVLEEAQKSDERAHAQKDNKKTDKRSK